MDKEKCAGSAARPYIGVGDFCRGGGVRLVGGRYYLCQLRDASRSGARLIDPDTHVCGTFRVDVVAIGRLGLTVRSLPATLFDPQEGRPLL